MKKNLCLLMLIVLALSSTGCSKDAKTEKATTTSTSSISTTTSATTSLITSSTTLTTTQPTTTSVTTTTTSATSKKTTTTTTTETTTTTTAYDYSAEIQQLQSENTKLQNEITDYYHQIDIEELNKQIYELGRSSAEDDVNEAEVQLENAKKKKVRVYGDGGWGYESDSEAVRKAEEYLNSCKDNLAIYENYIQASNSNIDYYNQCISNNQSQIDYNNSMISEYQSY